jgi:hypothetical protein
LPGERLQLTTGSVYKPDVRAFYARLWPAWLRELVRDALCPYAGGACTVHTRKELGA